MPRAAQPRQRKLSDEEIAAARDAKIANAAAPIGTGLTVMMVILGLTLAVGRGVAPSRDAKPLILGAIGLLAMLLMDVLAIGARPPRPVQRSCGSRCRCCWCFTAAARPRPAVPAMT